MTIYQRRISLIIIESSLALASLLEFIGDKFLEKFVEYMLVKGGCDSDVIFIDFFLSLAEQFIQILQNLVVYITCCCLHLPEVRHQNNFRKKGQ